MRYPYRAVLGDEVIKNELGGACSTYWEDEEYYNR
jgi:hypothetical protein